LVHTDAAIDVRGLAATATVTQQYVNSSTEPIEAIYVFPLPHDAAVYDMEIRIGNRVIRSVIREREEAKRVYEAANPKASGPLSSKKNAPIFHHFRREPDAGDHIDVRLRYVSRCAGKTAACDWCFRGRGPRYIPVRRPSAMRELAGPMTPTPSLTRRESLLPSAP